MNKTDPTGQSLCGTQQNCARTDFGPLIFNGTTSGDTATHIQGVGNPNSIEQSMALAKVSDKVTISGHAYHFHGAAAMVAHAAVQGYLAANSAGHTNVSKHNVSGKQSKIVTAPRAAQLSACSYNPSCNSVGNWNRTTAGVDPSKFNNSRSGFKAALFKNSKTGAYVLAFAGTDSLFGPDGTASVEQILGMRSPQFDEARKLTGMVLSRLPAGTPLMLTGHSLGGGLAALSALYWNIHAITFNAEGLSGGTISRYHLAAAMANANNLITAYHTTLDPLTLLQHLDPDLTVPGRSESVWNGLFSSGHSISSVCSGLGVQC